MIVKNLIISTIFFLIFIRFDLILGECGCGIRCSAYSLPKHCVRCCTSFVKREALPKNDLNMENPFKYRRNRHPRKKKHHEKTHWNNSEMERRKMYNHIFDSNVETVETKSISSSEDLLLNVISEIAEKMNRKDYNSMKI
uniref:Uncharacterized protein n=1 Tax=Strongyloides papillosus TaxID=174720 RepID=A0A0N5BPI4_STREA